MLNHTDVALVENRLIAALPPLDRDRLIADSEVVDLALMQVLHSAGEPIREVYFPIDSLVSLVSSPAPGGRLVEAGLIGQEGTTGGTVFLGIDRAPYGALCQVAGRARRMPAAALQSHSGGLVLHAMLRSYVQTLTNQLVLCAACNRLHPVAQRCARWLLMTHDRVGVDDLALSREMLALMLVAGHAGIDAALHPLIEGGAVRYRNGVTTVVDRVALEGAACPCYRLIADEEARLLG